MNAELDRLLNLITLFPGIRVLCIGDIMIDRYVYGNVSRISDEALSPILSLNKESEVLGGVGNVAHNVTAMGGMAWIVTIIGDDENARSVKRLAEEVKELKTTFVTVPGRRTTLKTRYIAGSQQLLRIDQEDTHNINKKTQGSLIDSIESALPEVDIVVLSDYAKGCLSDTVIASAIGTARNAGKPIIADPKSNNFSRYDGVNLIKPNVTELARATGIADKDDNAIVAMAQYGLNATNINAMLVTRSEHGMTLVNRKGEVRHFKEKRREIFDVTGAGDTALAILGLAIGAGASVCDAATLANKACSLVVAKTGTAVVYRAELMRFLQHTKLESVGAKIMSVVDLVDKVERWRSRGLTAGLTNGCFDLVHAGHVSLLTQAKVSCDRLIVALNSDNSVRRLKEEGRPINSENNRAIILASFKDVDAVVIFEEDTPMRLIDTLRPDVLIKGADYTEDIVVGADLVKSYGGRVTLVELTPELSTTNTIRKIKE